jgi:predicted transcriptional regulator
VVEYEGTLVGVIAKYDLAKMLESSEAGWRRRHQDRTLAKTIMSENLLTASPETSLVNAGQEMITNGVGCLPVVKDGELVGIFTETDLVTYFATTDSKGHQDYNDRFLSYVPSPPFYQPRLARHGNQPRFSDDRSGRERRCCWHNYTH